MASVTEFLYDFGIFHGNIKPSRIKFSPQGYDGFLFNGNLTILMPDDLAKIKYLD